LSLDFLNLESFRIALRWKQWHVVTDVWSARSKSLFQIDGESNESFSQNNRPIMSLDEEFVRKQGCETAHRLLYAHYEPQETARFFAVRENSNDSVTRWFRNFHDGFCSDKRSFNSIIAF
jgi:hypothetical protein